jgi:peptidoglycan-associated lipoprotein
MRRMNVVYLLLMVAAAAFFVTGCAKKPAPTVAAPVEESSWTAPPVETETPRGVDEQAVSDEPSRDRLLPLADATSAGLQRIHFGFDQHTLSAEAREILGRNADFLKNNTGVRVRIEGHTDERGSDEYNLALGERRARAARDYLISLGINGNRLSIISYGEEMPLERGATEASWAKNRRAEFNRINP